jgi:hypothetical protein
VQRQIPGKQNKGIEGQFKDTSLPVSPTPLSEREPNLPAPLRKSAPASTYDIPTVKPLSVACPPTEEGFGVLRVGNRIVYRGMWKYKRFHGKGKLSLEEYTYEGDFWGGLFHGRGCLKIGRLEYIGEFCENKAEGVGTLRLGDHQILGRWRSNLFVEKE